MLEAGIGLWPPEMPTPAQWRPSVLRLGRENGMCPRKRCDLSILSPVLGLFWVVFLDVWLVILNIIDSRVASNGCPISVMLTCIFTVCWFQLIVVSEKNGFGVYDSI